MELYIKVFERNVLMDQRSGISSLLLSPKKRFSALVSIVCTFIFPKCSLFLCIIQSIHGSRFKWTEKWVNTKFTHYIYNTKFTHYIYNTKFTHYIYNTKFTHYIYNTKFTHYIYNTKFTHYIYNTKFTHYIYNYSPVWFTSMVLSKVCFAVAFH